MIPRTLSASSLLVAESCLARWGAEYFHRASQPGGAAANVGTSVHYALELYVKAVVIDKTHEPSLQLIKDLYKMGYMATFDTANISTPEYEDGLELTIKWWKRTSFDGFEVISAELKSTFDVQTSAGPIPFNYIWDRCDRLDEDTVRVVDYKTIRVPINVQGLKEKIQPRCYGLAAQIQFPEAKKIWVQFDLLRHDPVGVVFTREDNIATWNFLKGAAERLIAADEENLPEKLNPDCRYCVRKHSCLALKKNVLAGGVFGITAEQAVDRRAEIDYAMKAFSMMAEELDTIILQQAEESMSLEWTTEKTKVKIGAQRRRNIDSERAARIVGPEIMSTYGKINLGDIDALLKGDQLTEDQKLQLKDLIYKTTGSPNVKVEPLSPIDDD